jgi:spore maturation protein CgeB
MNLNVLFLPIEFDDFKMDGFAKAFETLGCNVNYFSYFDFRIKNNDDKIFTRTKLLEIANYFKPDVFLIQTIDNDTIDSNTILDMKNSFPNCKFCSFTQDVRSYIPPDFIELSKVCEYNFSCSSGEYLKNLSKGIGKLAYYLGVGYNDTLYFPSKEKKTHFASDVVFLGACNQEAGWPGTKERMDAVFLLNKCFGNRFKIYGNGWPGIKSEGYVSHRENNYIYQNSFCNLSISHYNDIENYFSDRLLRCLASGRPTISYRFPNWQNYFTDMSDIVIANTVAEIPDKINMLKNNPDLANFIGKNGAAKVFAEHSYVSIAKQLFGIIGVC